MTRKSIGLSVILLLISTFFSPQMLFSEVITFKSGKKIQAKITERTETYIKADPGVGSALTFFLDDIDKIEDEGEDIYHSKERISWDAKKNANLIFMEGLKLATENNFNKAKAKFIKAIEINKFNYNSVRGLKIIADVEKGIIDEQYAVYLFRGFNYAFGKQLEPALSELEKAQEINSEYPELHFYLGYCYLISGECAQAVTYLQRYLQANPESGQTYSLLGFAYLAKNHKEARQSYLKARELFLQDGDYYNVERVDLEAAYVPEF